MTKIEPHFLGLLIPANLAHNSKCLLSIPSSQTQEVNTTNHNKIPQINLTKSFPYTTQPQSWLTRKKPILQVRQLVDLELRTKWDDGNNPSFHHHHHHDHHNSQHNSLSTIMCTYSDIYLAQTTPSATQIPSPSTRMLLPSPTKSSRPSRSYA